MEKLSDFGSNVFSQFGEDGIIAKIFSILGTTSRICVEFGAWDGFHLSNAANLWAKQGWKGVLIEADPERFQQLLTNTREHGCLCIQAKVGISGEDTLDRILQREGFKGEIDLLSIDIDSDDYYVFQSLASPGPRVIVCEYNPTIPPDLELIPEQGGYFGCSALSLVKVAETKGYKLVAVTDSNCFFVREADFVKFAAFQTTLKDIAVTRHLTCLMSGYGGDYVLSRQPTYGYSGPSNQSFAKGDVFYCRLPEAEPRARRPTWKPLENVRRRGQWSRFRQLADEIKPIYAEWIRTFPASEQIVHPVWQEARPAFVKLIEGGLPRDFLKDPTLANQFCRTGFGSPQQHELAYLRSRSPQLWSLLRQFTESPIGQPTLDCAELQISANSLGMLYYFARIAERLRPAYPRAILEFGAGYGCLCRVFWELLPEKPTYVIVDLPEMLALQHVFLQASSPDCRVVAHTAAPLKIVPNAVNLVPVWLAENIPLQPDLFVSTFALSETRQTLQQKIARQRFFDSASVYLVGQEVEAELWKSSALDSSQDLRQAVRHIFSEAQIQPYHFASAWEMFATRPKPL